MEIPIISFKARIYQGSFDINQFSKLVFIYSLAGEIENAWSAIEYQSNFYLLMRFFSKLQLLRVIIDGGAIDLVAKRFDFGKR